MIFSKVKSSVWLLILICFCLLSILEIMAPHTFLIQFPWDLYLIPGLILSVYFGVRGGISNAILLSAIYPIWHTVTGYSSSLKIFIPVLIINLAINTCIGILADRLKNSAFQKEAFKSFFEHNNDGILSTDLHGNITAVNLVASKMTGYTFEELQKINVTAFIQPQDMEESVSIFKRVTKGESIRSEVATFQKSGIPTDFAVECIPIIVDNTVVGAYAIFRDLTEQKNKELSFLSMFEFNPHSIVEIDANGYVLYCNPMAESITGYPKEELVGKRIFDLIPPEELNSSDQYIKKTLLGEGLNYDRKIINKNGHPVHLNITTVPIYSIDGSTIGIFAMGKDITKQKEIENALIENYEIFKKIFNDSQNIMFLFENSDNGCLRLVDVNQAACNKLGYSCAEFKTKSCVDLIYARNESDSLNLMKKLRSDGYLFIKTYLFTKNNEKIPVELRFKILEISDKKMIYADAREITETQKFHFNINKEDSGINLRMVMAEMNITASDLAEQTGLSRATISNLRNGKIQKPQGFTAKAVADALGVDISDIWPDIHD